MLFSGVFLFQYMRFSFYWAVPLAFIALLPLFTVLLRRKKPLPGDKAHPLQEGLGPREWEHQMAELSRNHGSVKWKKTNLIIGNNNQTAYKQINQIRTGISSASSDVISLIPSARWLFDNFQMMYREIKKVKTTGTNYLLMPALKTGKYRGYPRIYVIARKMVEISGDYLHENNITLMLKAYQKECPLTERELAVLLEMIGLCLLQRIIEVSKEILQVIQLKSRAERFVRQKLVEKQKYLDISPLLEKQDSQDISFHSHVLYLLKNMSVDDASITRYIAYHLGGDGRELNAPKIFKEEGRMESLLESRIRTPITSLRELNRINEEDLIEELSMVEQILSEDPDNVYSAMDSSSRGLYRAIIEKLSIRHSLNETDTARACLELAREGKGNIYCPRHVGAYLTGKGYPLLQARVLGRRTPSVLKDPHRLRGTLYFFLIVLLISAAVLLLQAALQAAGYAHKAYVSAILLLVSAPILLFGARKTAGSIMACLVPAQRLPLLDYSEELPESARTFLVMPVILSTREQAFAYAERLHKHYLANSQPNLFFALLVDYADAPGKEAITDEELRDALVSNIEQLNKKYPSTHQRFSLFIRERRWNEAEGCFMCWERKRGKLEEFNALLNGVSSENTSFTTLLCDRALLGTIRYVITLDADSDLIRDNAAKLAGMIDHPLHRAHIDPEKNRVTEGYAILQPLVKNHIYEKNTALFPKLFGGSSGLANYSVVVSDIYQDLFNEGSFVGKGIYNVRAFHQLLYRRIPENRILSHDLLESCYARTAFTSGANIVESFPASYLSFLKREHRWIRGDWQLLPWLFKRELSLLSKWKITDNLLSSLIPVSKALLILLNILLAPDIFWLWIPVVLFPTIFDLLTLVSGIILHKLRRPRLALVYYKFVHEIMVMLVRAFLEIIFLPAAVFNAVSAVATTLYRLAISKKHLLRWTSADHTEKNAENTLNGYFKSLGPSGLAFFILAVLFASIPGKNAGMAVLYSLLAALWGAAFLTAFTISMNGQNAPGGAQLDKSGLLRDTARRMWRFFRAFSTKENNWLCPDNYQFSGTVRVTTKTSPTNIGLQLLSILSARDFGFETLSSSLDLIENLLYTVNVLPKWHGHLYNWYDIATLGLLEPRYISTVDSGNFYAALIALKNGLLEQKETVLLQPGLYEELAALARDAGLQIPDFKNKTMEDLFRDLRRSCDTLPPEAEDNKKLERAEFLRLVELFAQEAESFGLEDPDAGNSLSQLAQTGNEYAAAILERITGLCGTIDNMLKNVDFTRLYNRRRMLFHIGYHVSSQQADAGCYDLIASEAMLTSFITIARGEAPVRHWQKLGRPLTLIRGIPAHVSWSGTMFEYLMPNLLLKEYEGSVFADSSRAAVMQQIRYADRMGLPWGISESQYHRFDVNANYQYRAFGVPQLRLQPTYAPSLVIAPYACMLALEYDRDKALFNLEKIRELGAYGEYGFYEAIDFNDPDPKHMTSYCIVRSYMAHHQGMSLVAINNYLNNGIMRRRFHAEPMVKATETLLEEKRQSWFVSISRRGYTVDIRKKDIHDDDIPGARYIGAPAPAIPKVGYFSNGSYSLLITSDGDGFSSCGNMMVNRWRPDPYSLTGFYIYIRDTEKDRYWSTSYNPTKTQADEYRVVLAYHQAEFIRRDADISTCTTVTISPDHDLELRKVTLKNYGPEPRQIEVTSYLEPVADGYMNEASHPAFNKLFLESEYNHEHAVFLCKRRVPEKAEAPFILHMVRVGAGQTSRVEYENDRARFIGRNNTLADPDALKNHAPLSNTAGFSTDPILSLRVFVEVLPGSDATVTYMTGACSSREEALRISREMSVPYRVDNIIEKSRLQSMMELKYLGISGSLLNAFQGVISPLYYPSRHFRGPAERIRRNWKDQNSLWRFGISGDKPIILLQVDSVDDSEIIRDVLKLYEYLRINRVNVDLVILSEARYGYTQELNDLLNAMTSSLKIYDDKDKPGIFIIYSYQMVPAEADLLFTVARVVFSSKTGVYFRSLEQEVKGVAQGDR